MSQQAAELSTVGLHVEPNPAVVRSLRPRLIVGGIACWSLLYFLYALFVSPLGETPKMAYELALPSAMPAVPQNHVRLAKQHLPQAKWVPQAKYQLQTEHSLIFAEDWQHLEENHAVRFENFAMIVLPRADADATEAPLTILSNAAIVQFARDFNMEDPNPGRIVGAALEGDVQIQGANGLEIVGRNFIFSESACRIWSDDRVEFVYGLHRGHGLGLQMELMPLEGAPPQDLPAVSGIRSFRLRRDVQLELSVEQQSSSRVTIQSAGSFDFHLQDLVATFENEVRINRPTSPVEFDSLTCDLLKLFFESPEEPEQQESKQDFQTLPAKLTLTQIQAEGRNVVLISQANDMVARLNELVYHLQQRIAYLSANDKTTVRYRQTELASQSITFQHNQENEIESAWCRGRGNLSHFDPVDGRLIASASWSEELRKQVDEQTGLDTITLLGDAILSYPEQKIGLAGQSIRLWYEVGKKVSVKTDQQSRPTWDRIQPTKLTAEKDVAVLSPQFQGKTNKLTANINWLANEPTVVTTEQSPANNERASDTTPDKSSADPVQLTADDIEVQLTADGSRRVDLKQVIATDHLQAIQQSEPGAEPARMSGDRLQIDRDVANEERFHLSGSPAKLHSHEIHVEGEHIYLDRLRNQSWVEGPGLLQLPVSKSLDGDKLSEPQNLEVWWQERMQFDGRKASFFRDVHAVMGESRLSCQAMDVELTREISFQQDTKPRDAKVEIEQITCHEGVELDSYEYEAGKLTGVRRARFWNLTIFPQTGKARALGPGELIMSRRGKGDRAKLAPVATVAANEPVHADQADWEYTRVNFVGETEGNFQQRCATFRDRVQIVYGPVEQPLQTIDPDKLPKDGGWMRCDRLELFHRTLPDSTERYFELLATGNAELEGSTFHARANSISFDESKGLYMLRSLGNNKATIWRQKTPGADYSRAEAQRMEFSPSRQKLKLDQTIGLQGVQ